MNQEILQKIDQAEMILVGLGEEFEEGRILKMLPGYGEVAEKLAGSGNHFCIPAWNRQNLLQSESKLSQALTRLAQLLQGKDYFVVTTATNDFIWDSPLDKERITAPCGGSCKKQCENGCGKGLMDLTEEESRLLQAKLVEDSEPNVKLGICPECGNKLILNNIYAEQYDENGYLPSWQFYRKWLERTLHRKLLVLELGVGMQYPSVIRFPFEKAAYFNQKADFVRVNERLYQLSAELGERGTSISENAVDFLCREYGK